MVISLREIPTTQHISDHPEAKRRPHIIFVHNYGGSEQTSWRHVKLIQELGYNSVTFSLSNHGENPRWALPWNEMVHWGNEIQRVLDQVKAKEKILFCFSGPAASGLYALTHNGGRKDVVGYICDSGPFVDAWSCTRRMISEVKGIHNPFLRELDLVSMMVRWGFHHDSNLKASVRELFDKDSKFPILSIRGTEDQIIPVENIDAVFKPFKFQNLTILLLKSGHLTALKDHPEEYRQAVKKFIDQSVQSSSTINF